MLVFRSVGRMHARTHTRTLVDAGTEALLHVTMARSVKIKMGGVEGGHQVILQMAYDLCSRSCALCTGAKAPQDGRPLAGHTWLPDVAGHRMILLIGGNINI